MWAGHQHGKGGTVVGLNSGRLGDSRPLRISLLGSFRIQLGPRTIEEGEWRLRKAASIIKLLALVPEHRVHRERIMDLFWPKLDPEAAANNLRYALHYARRMLEPGLVAASSYLRVQDEQVALAPAGRVWVDVEAFEKAATTARHARVPVAYRAAVDLYAGDVLPGDLYEDWVEGRRAGLRTLYLALLKEMADLYEEREALGAAVEALNRVVASEPGTRKYTYRSCACTQSRRVDRRLSGSTSYGGGCYAGTSPPSPRQRAGISTRRIGQEGPHLPLHPTRRVRHGKQRILVYTIYPRRGQASSAGRGRSWRSDALMARARP